MSERASCGCLLVHSTKFPTYVMPCDWHRPWIKRASGRRGRPRVHRIEEALAEVRAFVESRLGRAPH